MSQAEVLEYLKRYKNKRRWFSSKDIAKGSGCSHQVVITNLKKLRLTTFIRYKVTYNYHFRYEYMYS